MTDPEWWLPLSSYRAMCRDHIAYLTMAHGVRVTFRGARRIYKRARDGMVYVHN